MAWEPLEDGFNINVDANNDKFMPVLPCVCRGKTIPKLYEMKPPAQLQKLIEKNFPQKKPLGRGRGRFLKKMQSKPGHIQTTNEDSDTLSMTSASSSRSQQMNSCPNKFENAADDCSRPKSPFSNISFQKNIKPTEWTDADFPTLSSSPAKPKPKSKTDSVVSVPSASPAVESAIPSHSLPDSVNTVLIENLPKDIPPIDIRNLLDAYGQVLNLELSHHEDSTSCKAKLDSAVSCEWAVACLHDTDSLFPEDDKLITCIQLG